MSKRNINRVASLTPSTGDLANTPGVRPDWELNQQPFQSQAGAQSTEPHQPGHFLTVFVFVFFIAQNGICSFLKK